jgi:hypothetical protein
VDAAALGCTAAAGTVGGAKRECDTHPKQLSGTWRRRGMVGSAALKQAMATCSVAGALPLPRNQL